MHQRACCHSSQPRISKRRRIFGNSYVLLVRVSDGIATDEQQIVVSVTNVNEAPVITSSGGARFRSVVSSARTQTAVTTVAAAIPEAGT